MLVYQSAITEEVLFSVAMQISSESSAISQPPKRPATFSEVASSGKPSISVCAAGLKLGTHTPFGRLRIDSLCCKNWVAITQMKSMNQFLNISLFYRGWKSTPKLRESFEPRLPFLCTNHPPKNLGEQVSLLNPGSGGIMESSFGSQEGNKTEPWTWICLTIGHIGFQQDQSIFFCDKYHLEILLWSISLSKKEPGKNTRDTHQPVFFYANQQKKNLSLTGRICFLSKTSTGDHVKQISSPSGQQRIVTHLHVPPMNHQHFIWKDKVTQAVQK